MSFELGAASFLLALGGRLADEMRRAASGRVEPTAQPRTDSESEPEPEPEYGLTTADPSGSVEERWYPIDGRRE